MKKQKHKNARRVPDEDATDQPDWTPLMFGAFQEAFEWALDVAARLAHDYPEEVEAVERVRSFVRKRIAGERAQVRLEDVVFTLGLIIGAIERDLGPIVSRGPRFAAPMRCPSANELWEQRLPFHVNPARWIDNTVRRYATA